MQIEYNMVTDNTKIIDIRNTLDFSNNHIPGSVNIPRLTLMSDPEIYMNKDDDYYLICDKGKVSLSCARILNALGYKCYSIIGGIEKIRNLI